MSAIKNKQIFFLGTVYCICVFKKKSVYWLITKKTTDLLLLSLRFFLNLQYKGARNNLISAEKPSL